MNSTPAIESFSPYQKFVVVILGFLNFTIMIDFMILSPLGAILMPELKISPAQFSMIVSIYAISAGASGLLAAGFADKFDRKRLLLVFYAGFVVGTFLCGIAEDFHFLLLARLVTGLFGGVIGSIVAAITTDLFPMSMRGRVMGILQTAFAASQVLGLPIGLFLANHWGWHSPFILIVIGSLMVGAVIILKLHPIDEHLKLKIEKNAFRHLLATLMTPRYAFGFCATALLSLGGFMLMPFSSAFNVYNLGVSLDHLPIVYLVTGLSTMFFGPLIGRLSDLYGKYPVFVCGSLFGIVMSLTYTQLGISPLWLVVLVSSLMFIGISSRIIASQALMSAVPEPASRGSYMAIGMSMQQIAGGIGSLFAGMIVTTEPSGHINHMPTIGYILATTSLISVGMIYFINRMLLARSQSSGPISAGGKASEA